MELQIQDLVSSIRKEGMPKRNLLLQKQKRKPNQSLPGQSLRHSSLRMQLRKKSQFSEKVPQSVPSRRSVMLSWHSRPRFRASSKRSSLLISEKSFLVKRLAN